MDSCLNIDRESWYCTSWSAEGSFFDRPSGLPESRMPCSLLYRKLETLIAVVAVFVVAYNKFGDYKVKHRIPVVHKTLTPNKHLHKFRDYPLGLVDFI